MKKMFVMILAAVMGLIITSCGAANEETKREVETTVQGVKLEADGYMIGGEYCASIEKLHLYDEYGDEYEVISAEEYCKRHGYDDILYREEDMKLIAIDSAGSDYMWFIDQLAPVNWIEAQ